MSERDRDDELDPGLREAVGRLPRSIEPPRDLWPEVRERIRTRGGRWSRRTVVVRWLPLAAAAALLIAVSVWLTRPGTPATWELMRVAGAPRVDGALLSTVGTLRVGQWLETDDSSRAVIAVGAIGHVDVKPRSRVRLVQARATDHRLALVRGSIYAQVDAPPRLFFVETPAGTAVDLGCAYTLDVDSSGNGVLRVTAGYVEYTWSGRRSIVPLGAAAETRAGAGPGIPYAHDASEALQRALREFDFAAGGAAAARAVLAAARPEDAVSLWHLLQRVDAPLRPAVYYRLAELVPPPAGVAGEEALRLEAGALERYWERIRRIAWRREILRGVREIDPRTGLGLGARDSGIGTHPRPLFPNSESRIPSPESRAPSPKPRVPSP